MTTPIQNSELHAAFTLLQKANALRDKRQGGYPEVYESALKLIDNLHGDDANNLKANIWTNHGIALLTVNSADGWKQAVTYFDRAIDLRKSLPLDQSPVFPWGLAAAWMNRADALSRIDRTENLEEIIRSFDQAIEVLTGMQPDAHPSQPSRIAVAWMNRGLALETSDPTEALSSLNNAISICEGIPADHAGAEEGRRVYIGALLNKTVLQSGTAPDAAWPEAKRVLELTQPLETTELMAAEIGLRARYLLCRLFATVQPKETDDWITEMTDAIDEGLNLARHWLQKDVPVLQPLAAELFRFGLNAYIMWQPHFLAEFILDNLDPDRTPNTEKQHPAMHQLAAEAVWQAVVAINKEIQNPESKANKPHLQEILQELQTAETRLGQLRPVTKEKDAQPDA